MYGHCTNLPLKTVTYRPFPLSGQQIFKFSGTNNAYATKLFNSHRPSLKYQHGHHFIVLRHKYGGRQVMWKHCINLVLLPTLLFYPADQRTDQSRLLEMCQELMINIRVGTRKWFILTLRLPVDTVWVSTLRNKPIKNAVVSPAKTSVSPRSSQLGTFREEPVKLKR